VELADSHGVERPSFTKAALLRLRDHGWPGNVRELRNLCERTAILLPGREVDASNLPAGLAGESNAEADAAVALPAEGVRLEDVEADLIRQALARTEGNRSHAARLLGISRHTLLYRLRKHAIA
jgi:DNA-binding NtrC family response regulator